MPQRFDSPEWMERERALLARARAGDGEAFGELYRAFAPRLYAQVLMPRLSDPAQAQDALAETFRVLLERLGDFREQGVSLFFWLARVAANQAMDRHRAAGRAQRAIANCTRLLLPLWGSDDGFDQAADPEAPARLQAAVRGVLQALNPRYQRAIELRFFQERSREDCAATLQVKIGTFDVLLLRALRAFRKGWEARVGRPPEEG